MLYIFIIIVVITFNMKQKVPSTTWQVPSDLLKTPLSESQKVPLCKALILSKFQLYIHEWFKNLFWYISVNYPRFWLQVNDKFFDWLDYFHQHILSTVVNEYCWWCQFVTWWYPIHIFHVSCFDEIRLNDVWSDVKGGN